MKLLLDQNLAPALAVRLLDIFPDSSHVSHFSLDQATDMQIWEFARSNNFTLVTKDSDFDDLSLLRGFPPKVIWLRTGNCTTAAIELKLRQVYTELVLLDTDTQAGTLVIR